MRFLLAHGATTARKASEVTTLVTLGAVLSGCAGGGAGSGPPPPPPPAITVSVTPLTASVLLGRSTQLAATVSGTDNKGVTWSVNGILGGNGSVGTISESGLYLAPADLPSPTQVQVTATSMASSSSHATAQITITSDISVSLPVPAATVELGAKQTFAATITSAGAPDPAIRWTLSGGACPLLCGSADSSGAYTAPSILPSPATVNLTAQSVADPAKQATVLLTVASDFTLQLSAPSNVWTSTTAAIAATLTPVPGSNPSPVLNWSLSGAGCTGSSCGTLSSLTTQQAGTNTGSGTDSETANYTAPVSAPVPNTVTITVTALADPSKHAQATVAVQAGVGVTLLPISAALAINHRITFSVGLSGTGNSEVSWSVNGVPSGSPTFGLVCVVGSNPCTPVTTSSATQVDYVAPAAMPLPNPVTVQATSVADTMKAATAQVTILNHLVVSVLPGTVTLAPGAAQVFTATVLGSLNQNVVWQLHGGECSAAGACGIIDSHGNYAAPGTPPTPNSLQVVAVSSDDTSQSGTASVTVTSGANLTQLHPASVYAGGALGFTLRVDGGGFETTTAGPGSAILVGGSTRTTSCLTEMECTAPVFSSDVAVPGGVNIQIRNPDGALSNVLSLVVVTPNSSDETISMTGSAPAAIGKDIMVVEPSTAGVSLPGDNVDLNLAALGVFDAGSNTCSLGGNSIVLIRPATGATSLDICAFSQSGLDTSMSYTISGAGDVSVIAKQPVGLGIIRLTLQVAGTAQTGSRTLFVQNLNLDKTAASGVLEVQ